MGKGLRSCFLLLVLVLTCASAIQELKSLEDLQNVEFGRPFPRHGLMLLHWLANNIDIDNVGVMSPNFEPSRGDYGIHYYGNLESLLPPLQRWQGCYYSLGNLNPESHNNARALPPDVTEGFYNSHEDRNRDRIVIRSRQDTQSGCFRVEEVYITQHYPLNHQRGSAYDPRHTFFISPNLLRGIRQLQSFPIFTPLQSQHSVSQNVSQNHLQQLRVTWEHLAYVGLLLLIVLGDQSIRTIAGVTFAGVIASYLRRAIAAHNNVSRMKLEVKTTGKGKARISWRDIPKELLDQGVMVVLFKDNDTDDKLSCAAVKGRDSGSYDTEIPLNPGLQVRIHQQKTWWFFWSVVRDEIWRGPEFHDANREIPVYIPGYGASLQLFVKDGMACARLFVKKSFTDWDSKFNCSWVGFYHSQDKPTNDYATYQYAVKFSKEIRCDLARMPGYDVYVYVSNMAISPGVQARFMLERRKGEMVRTPVWERQTLEEH